MPRRKTKTQFAMISEQSRRAYQQLQGEDECEKMGLAPSPVTTIFRGEFNREMEKRMADLLMLLKENQNELHETRENVCWPHIYLIEPIKQMEKILQHHRMMVSWLNTLEGK